VFDQPAAQRPPAIRNPSTRARRYTIAGVLLTALLLGVLAGFRLGTPQDRGLAAVEQRKEAPRPVAHEIGKRHFAGQDEGYRARE